MTDSRLENVVNNCGNTNPGFCGGYMEPTATGYTYISAIVLSTGAVTVTNDFIPLDEGMENIVSYDRAEKNDAYVGEINMLQASSFNGVNGAIWGYDMAKDPRIGNMTPFLTLGKMPVYSIIPLRDAGRQLFGTNDQRHFPPLKGAHVICAEKSHTSVVLHI